MLDRVKRFDRYLEHIGVEQAGGVNASAPAIRHALERFHDEKLIQQLGESGGVIYQIYGDKRITLEYYKNALVHFVAPISLMAAAIRGCRDQHVDGCFPMDEACRLYLSQVFLLRYEFTLDPSVPINALMERSLHHLQWFGAIEMGTNEEHGGFEYRIAEREWISELAEITRNFLESYYVVLKGLESLKGYAVKRADLPERLKEVGRLLVVDEIRRPEACHWSI